MPRKINGEKIVQEMDLGQLVFTCKIMKLITYLITNTEFN